MTGNNQNRQRALSLLLIPENTTRPKRPESDSLPGNQSDRSAAAGVARELAGCVAVLVFISAIWHESDAYRYIAIATLIPVTLYYFRAEFFSSEKVLIGYMGFLCISWGLYVTARFLYDYSINKNFGIGSSEGIYTLSVFYSITGYAIFVFVRRPIFAVLAFVLISFLVVLYSFDLSALLEGRRPSLIFHDNPIHTSVAQGMIILCVLPFMSYLLCTSDMRAELRIGLVIISIATLFFGLANIYALKSKGVWLALIVALPIQLLLIVAMHSARRNLVAVMSLVFVALVITVVVAWDGIQAVAGDTAQKTAELLSDILGGAGVLQSMDQAIQDDTVPRGLRERLMLWASAILIWAENPIWGQGVTWLDEWQTRAYPDANHNLLHNGYLEIAIRYGIMGLIFYGVLYSWTIRQVWRAKREGIIDPAAFNAYIGVFLFFCLTILSNSNVRLAIGESYMWFSAAFGFYCFYHLQRRGCVQVRTWM
ncbi:O-antigen ligase family protein [Chelativorans sp. YIM 93263]|uniref:O-antigen ligase family protein n=1 Tax=Chelativorans sp. YIM 93263 TaxID=2906648 RepID=UPI00237A0513|nr:O-antigen ligase family protein [Chelativorans sp. YIM 93263]